MAFHGASSSSFNVAPENLTIPILGDIITIPSDCDIFARTLRRFEHQIEAKANSLSFQLQSTMDAEFENFQRHADSRFDTVERRLRRLNHRTGEFERSTHVRLSRVEARLDGIDTRLDGIDIRLDGMDARLNGIDTRLDGIDTRLDGIETRLDTFEKNTNARLDKLEVKVDAMSNKLDQILLALGGTPCAHFHHPSGLT